MIFPSWAPWNYQSSQFFQFFFVFFPTLCPWVTTAASVLGCLRFGALRIFHLRPLRHSSWARRWGVLGEERRAKRVLQNIHMGLSENVGYIPNYSHLIGIMISKTSGCRGTLFSDKPIYYINIYNYIHMYTRYHYIHLYTHILEFTCMHIYIIYNVCICAICMWCITKRWDVLSRSQRILGSDPDSTRLGTQSWSVVRIEHDLYTPIQQTKIIYTIDIPLIYHWYTIDIPLIYHWYTIDMHVLLTLMIDFSWSSSFYLPRMQKIQVESNAEQLFRDMSATLLLEMHSIVPWRYQNYQTPEDPQPHHLISLLRRRGGKPPHWVWVARYMMI